MSVTGATGVTCGSVSCESKLPELKQGVLPKRLHKQSARAFADFKRGARMRRLLVTIPGTSPVFVDVPEHSLAELKLDLDEPLLKKQVIMAGLLLKMRPIVKMINANLPLSAQVVCALAMDVIIVYHLQTGMSMKYIV